MEFLPPTLHCTIRQKYADAHAWENVDAVASELNLTVDQARDIYALLVSSLVVYAW
jgi:hypothetical protein